MKLPPYIGPSSTTGFHGFAPAWRAASSSSSTSCRLTARCDDGTGERPAVVVDVSGYHRPDLVLVDVLSRVRLVAGRLGAVVEVRGAGHDLARLLLLAGLLAVVPVDGVALASEVGGEP